MPEAKTRRSALLLFVVAACLFHLNKSEKLAVAGDATEDAAQAVNLLLNPGFEGAYRAWNGIPEVQVAASWTPWWWEDPTHNPAYYRPEYKQALASIFPKRVLGGESAQQWFTFHASHVAGMYQQVFNVTPGQRYRFSIWAQVWSSAEDNPNSSVSPANPHLQIGIDPTGNWNSGAPTITWSGEAPMSGVIDQWGLMVVEATAESDVITVFMRTNPDFANKHNDMYWDNAALEAVQPPQPISTPSPSPAPITSTPQPTATPAATATLASTQTPTPAATETQTPTTAPTAASTQTSTRTETPIPANTAMPSVTPRPTETQAESQASIPDDEPESDMVANFNQQGGSPAQQAGQGTAEPDSLGIVALGAIGTAIALLLFLIIVLIRGMRVR
jgi:hypothetical protein